MAMACNGNPHARDCSWETAHRRGQHLATSSPGAGASRPPRGLCQCCGSDDKFQLWTCEVLTKLTSHKKGTWQKREMHFYIFLSFLIFPYPYRFAWLWSCIAGIGHGAKSFSSILRRCHLLPRWLGLTEHSIFATRFAPGEELLFYDLLGDPLIKKVRTSGGALTHPSSLAARVPLWSHWTSWDSWVWFTASGDDASWSAHFADHRNVFAHLRGLTVGHPLLVLPSEASLVTSSLNVTLAERRWVQYKPLRPNSRLTLIWCSNLFPSDFRIDDFSAWIRALSNTTARFCSDGIEMLLPSRCLTSSSSMLPVLCPSKGKGSTSVVAS